MSTGPQRTISTKEKLVSIVDDIETIVKELLETTIAPKSEKLSHADQSNLIQLLMQKQDTFKSTLALASEQQQIDSQMIQLQQEVQRQDQDIQVLQKQLKEAETILSTALFQAKQKLDQIQKAQTHQVSSEDLIRFAHRVSSTNAVAAPATWLPGDPRRPYPTDIDMRKGLLARINDMPISQVLDSLHPSQTPQRDSSSAAHQFFQNAASTQPWYASSTDLPPLASNNSSSLFPLSEPVSRASNNHDDVEVMSTDSSSSSSSDSQ